MARKPRLHIPGGLYHHRLLQREGWPALDIGFMLESVFRAIRAPGNCNGDV